MKRFFFMAGLPRSGSTLLANILNENPDVYASALTDTTQVLRYLHQQPASFESFQLGAVTKQYDSLLKHSLEAAYQDIPERYVIDKNRMWGTPYYLRLLEFILGEPPKIICPVRPLPEIVASFIRKANENPETNFIDRNMVNEDFLPYWRKPLNDARVDWLLKPGNMTDAAMLSLAGSFRDESASSFHLVPYERLISKPQETLDGIYGFLGIPRFHHTLDLIGPGEKHNDADVLGIPDLHAVRPSLTITAPPPEEVLSQYGMQRCLLEDFWTNGSA